MTTVVNNTSVRLNAIGRFVQRPTAALPATATGSIFTISGGAVLLTSFVARVTTAIQNQACSLSVGITPTVGSAQNAALASSTSIIAAIVGNNWSLNSTIGGALITGTLSVANVPVAIGLPASLLYLPVGAVTVTTTATNTGSVEWLMTYVPLESGSAVVAA